MADQVNPIGSLTPGLTAALTGPSAPPASGTERTASTQAPPRVDSSPAAGAQAPNGGAAPSRTPRPNPSSLEEATKTLQAFLKTLPSDLQFREDSDSGKLFFKVVNPVTREVIRQIPSEEVLAMARKLKELDPAGTKAPGLLLDHEG